MLVGVLLVEALAAFPQLVSLVLHLVIFLRPRESLETRTSFEELRSSSVHALRTPK